MKTSVIKKDSTSNLKALFFGVILTVSLVFAVDWIFGFFQRPAIYKTGHSPNYFYVDNTGSWRPSPNAKHEHWNVAPQRDNALIYRVTYSIDEYSRRITPVENAAGRDKHLIFFGCSFVYGVGVKANETIPYYTAEKAREYMPYNYGFQGHSPSQMLVRLETEKLPEEVSETEGYLIFTFIGDHIFRSVGSMGLTASWGATAPYYEWKGGDSLVHKGTFTTGRAQLTNLYKMLRKSNTLRFFNIDFPLKKTSKHFEFTARLIAESKRLYQKQFPKGKFVVLIYPNTTHASDIEKHLALLDVDTLRYPALLDPEDPQFVLAKEDLHPTALANKILADQLVTDLNLAG